MKEVIITIKSSQELDGDVDTTELITEGGYELFPDGCSLSYQETEATGYEGSSTSVRVENGKCLEMLRSGSVNSELLIETHRKNYCRYGTPYGDLTVGVIAKYINADLDENGGMISAEYTMDINSISSGNYKLDITVKNK